jgi:HAD superfamily hydrolase (TIGR01509 family)
MGCMVSFFMSTGWYRSLCYMSLLLSTSAMFGDAIVFDLGGVLVETRMMYSVKKLGIRRIIWYMLSTGKGVGGLRDTFYRFMHEVKAKNPQQIMYKDEHGQELPQLMCDWLQGIMPAQKIRELLCESIERNRNFFANTTEQELVKALVCMIFTPHVFAKTREINSHMVEFVKKCKEAGHSVYVLSNWDAESFEWLYAKNLHLFSLFDGIMISGSEHCAKPDQALFSRFLDRYNLTAQECWFIDDQYDNVQAARACGMRAVVYKKSAHLDGILSKRRYIPLHI